MEARVVLINPRRGFVAVQADDGDVTVFEVLGDYAIDVGDMIVGEMHAGGGEDFYNTTKGEQMSVYVQGYGCSIAGARSIMGF